MKKTFILLLLSIGLAVQAQASIPEPTGKDVNYEAKVDSLLTRIDSLMTLNSQLLEQVTINTSLKGRYKLYQTDNYYTLLQLDTKTGQVQQVQWSLNSKEEMCFSINSVDLTFGYGYGSGSFELYPTKNMYQFILINKTNGEKWHIQWGMKRTERWIRRIFDE